MNKEKYFGIKKLLIGQIIEKELIQSVKVKMAIIGVWGPRFKCFRGFEINEKFRLNEQYNEK